MSETQPPKVVEGATPGDVEDEVADVPKNAEDRKAAAALSSLDSREDDSATGKDVDQEAVRKAMSRLAGPSAATAELKNTASEKKEVKKVIKVDQADVALVVEELDLSKPKATELLKAHDGEVLKALRAFVQPSKSLLDPVK